PLVSLAERQRHRSSKPDRWVRLPQDTLGDRLTVGRQPLKLRMEVRVLLPELHRARQMEPTNDNVQAVLHKLARSFSPRWLNGDHATLRKLKSGFASRLGYSTVIFGVCRIARDPAKVEDQVQFLEKILRPV